MRRLKFLVFLGTALIGFSTSSVFSFVGPNVEYKNWSFTLPVDGDQIAGPVGVVGTGPMNSIAIFSQFTQVNSDPTGVFDYELTLVTSSLKTNTTSPIWGDTGVPTVGPSFMTICPVGNAVEVEDGPPGTIPDPSEPVDVGNVVFVAGGDSVSYLGLPVTP